mgnify:CR=1 FL=1
MNLKYSNRICLVFFKNPFIIGIRLQDNIYAKFVDFELFTVDTGSIIGRFYCSLGKSTRLGAGLCPGTIVCFNENNNNNYWPNPPHIPYDTSHLTEMHKVPVCDPGCAALRDIKCILQLLHGVRVPAVPTQTVASLQLQISNVH